ncbi:phosphopentomutase [Hasllibacter halocynthiae]|uniref:Phosphopentomutase n=1 Tax=Hasllibacter halocynthiae TaxID=595589 RepID=A0A2T0X6D6_9RHOB|nr:phosphopentomutase [Hasllibacter halocynthiae]PRY94508.1 phosphopentomutase [Hasllibacter halocynthiae]
MRRVFLIVLDSVGIGGAPDAADFGDEGADTTGHIRAAVGLDVPVLDGLGLAHAHAAANGQPVPKASVTGRWGAATEASRGKDTPSGHWELAGLPVPFEWTYFPDDDPAFPSEVMTAVAEAAGTRGTLGNAHASGTDVIARLGEEHLRTGRPILYTSADSVVQIAAHEEAFGLERLLEVCRAVAPALHARKVGRVIARPFIGEPGTFERTANRRDFALEPPGQTLLDLAAGAGREVVAVGKIADIFAGRGVTRSLKGRDAALMAHLDALAVEAPEGALVFANLVEFDSEYGHRRDPEGYARALERFDRWLGPFLAKLRAGDLVVVTADHGNDPTWRGTDHTRERVPVLIHGAGVGPLGPLAFSDVGATVASWLDLPQPHHGRNAL